MAKPTQPTKLESYTAPDTGGQYVATGGQVWLTKGGKYFRADPAKLDQVYGELGEGTRAATADEVSGRLREKASDNVEGKVATVIENVAIGAVSAAAAPVRGVALLAGQDELAKTLTGESFARDLAGVAALHSKGGNASASAKAANEWDAELQARRSLFPTLSSVSQAAGEIGQVVATGGLSAAPGLVAGRSLPSAALRLGAASGAENAILATGQETGQAALENRAIDRERLAADGLTAAVLGFALGGGGAVAARGASALKARVFRGATADGAGEAARAAERAGGAPGSVEETLDLTRREATAAAEAAGINPVAREAAATAHAEGVAERAAAADPSNWRQLTNDANPHELFIHRDAVLDGATRDAADDLDKILQRQRPIYDEIDNFSAKREKVRDHITADGVDETELLARAQQDTAALRDRLEGMRAQMDSDRAANAMPDRAPGAANDALTPKKFKKTSADQALNRANFVVRQAEKNLAKAESGADGVVAVDSMRRELSRVWRQARASLGQTPGLEDRMLLEPVRDFLREEYQRAADSLMDPTFVGTRQAAAQKAVNTARVGAIDGETFDLKGFVVRTGSDQGEDFGRVAHGANRDALRSMLAEIQPGPAARLKTEQIERFLTSQEEFFRAAKENYSLTPANAKRMDELLGAVTRFRSTIDLSRDAAGKVNQARALLDADKIGGGRIAQMVAGSAVGGVEGGIGGALRGFARGALGGTEQAVLLRQRMAALAESHDSKIAASMTGWIDKLLGVRGDVVGRAGKKGGRKLLSDETRAAFGRAIPEEKTMLGGALGLSPALRRFVSLSGETRAEKRELLQERRHQLAELITNPARIQRAAEAVLGQSSQYMPGMAAEMVAETVQRLTALHGKLGGSSTPSLLPGVKQPEMVSDQELRAQDSLVQATVNPMSVFADFAQGKIDPLKTAFVREMYPQIWAQAQAAAIDSLGRLDKMPSRQALTQMDQFLGLEGSLDSSLRPDFLARQAERAKSPDAQDKPVAPSAQRAPKIAGQFATTSQRLSQSSSNT